MAVQTHAKHLGVLPRCHTAVTDPERRTSQTALRRLCRQTHLDAERADRRRVPEFLLQIRLLSGRPDGFVQAGAGSGECVGVEAEREHTPHSFVVFEQTAEVFEGVEEEVPVIGQKT